MGKLKPKEEKVYKAVRYIEEYGGSAVFSYARTIASFLKGNSDSPNAWFYSSAKDLFGSIPDLDWKNVIFIADGLIRKGFLRRESVNGKIRYFSTGKDPYSEEKLTLSWNLNEKKKEALARFLSYMKHYFGAFVVGQERQSYYGFKRKPERDDEVFWFWISDNPRSSTNLILRIREDPRRKIISEEHLFSNNSVRSTIEKLIDAIGFRGKVSLPPIVVKEVEPLPLEDILPDLQEKKLCLNNDDDPIQALIALGDCSPFYYRDSTSFVPEKLKEGHSINSELEYSTSKWKLVAWTTEKTNSKKICDALLVDKGTKKTWVVVSVPNHRVTCYSRRPFTMCFDGKTMTPEAIISFVFSA